MEEKVKTIPIRTMIILFFIVLILLFISIYTSLAAFKINYEKENIVAIKVKDISPTITTIEENFKINEDGKSGVITVLPDEEQFFNLTLTNNETINVRYGLYYKSSLEENVEVGLVEEISENILNSKEEKTVRVGVRNLGIESATVTIGTQGGYENNELKLNEGRTKLEIIKESYKDETGANRPKIASGMIPVTYDEATDTWKKADRTEAWYNYEKQEWANVVTVKEEASICEGDECIDQIDKKSRNEYRLAPSGTPISMDDINSMWVWIPRYKYRIPSNIGSTTDVTNPPMIDVVFETGLSSTGVREQEYRDAITDEGTVPDNIYYTHPAFKNGEKENNGTAYDIGGWDTELTGIWVAKFETGTDNELCNSEPNEENCKEVTPIIKPNIRSLRYQNISTQFKTSLKFTSGIFNDTTGEVTFSNSLSNSYGLNTKNINTNSHMMKSIEWGSVAYLSQSRYGKMGNNNYKNDNKQIYGNTSSSRYTGRSSGLPSNGKLTTSGTYSYNGIVCNDENCIIGEKTDESKLAGYGASTSGTIYGIYDMSGGSYEHVMGNSNNSKSSSGFNMFPNRKYYDLYNKLDNSVVIKKEKAILGDATWETMGWYGDYKEMPNNDWAHRGGQSGAGDSTYRGMFCSDNFSGISQESVSFRTVLIP